MKFRLILMIVMTALLAGCGTHPDVFRKQNMEQIAKRKTYGRVQQEGTATVELFNGTYHGELKNGLFHGQGQFKWNSGHSYQGTYVNGKMQGQGTFTWPDGTRYSGMFGNGKRDGKGDIFWRDGRIFSGEFAGGNLIGKGEMRLRNKSKIAGAFSQDQYAVDTADIIMPSNGVITFPDGTKFEGDIVNNFPGLQGIYLSRHGALRQGKGKCYVETGIEKCRFVDGHRMDDLYLVRVERLKLQQMLEQNRKQKLVAQGARNDVPHNRIPKPIMNNSGRYMSPYTQDGVMTEWCDMAMSAKIGKVAGGTVGATAGAIAGKMVADKVLDNVPFGGLLGGIAGGIIGNEAGKKAGGAIGLQAAGGMEHVRATSDMSFNSLRDMSVYLYAMHSNHEHYQKALEITMEVYPELKRSYNGYIAGM